MDGRVQPHSGFDVLDQLAEVPLGRVAAGGLGPQVPRLRHWEGQSGTSRRGDPAVAGGARSHSSYCGPRWNGSEAIAARSMLISQLELAGGAGGA